MLGREHSVDMAFHGLTETPPPPPPPPPEAAGQDDNVDLELRLGLLPPRSIIDRSSAKHDVKIPGAVETGFVVLALFTVPSESESSGTDYDTPEGPMSAPPAPATEPLHEVKAEELVTTGEEAIHEDIDASGTVPVPAWMRAELLPRHGLPRDPPLHFIGAKDLARSDLHPGQARFLVPSVSGASDRLRAFLSAEEIQVGGFDSAHRTAAKGGKSKRAKAMSYDGVPVSVYVRGGDWGVSEQKLKKFHGSAATVINGARYTSFMERCGFEAGDHVELWAFRRPSDHPCFVIAKM